jgi:cobalt-zinc-cadmium efflux system outer membrane protein
MKNIGIWMAAVLAMVAPSGLQAQSPPTDTLSLDQVVREVLRHNDGLKAAAFMEEAARRQVGPAGAWDDPMLMLGIENLPPSFRFDEEMMTMKAVGLSQRIPYAGERGLQAKAQRAEAEATGEDRRQKTLDLVAAAKTAYAELYYHQRLIDDLERQRELAEQIATSVRSRLEANLAGQDELNAALATMWRLEAEILTHHNDAHTAHHRLDALRGVVSPADMPAVVPPAWSALPDTFQVWLDSARAHYAPLRALARRAERYRLSARASRRMSWPMLELSAEYGIRDDLRLPGGERMAQDDMWSFGATFSLPVFRGRKERQMALSMTAMQQQMEAEAAQLAKDVDAELRALHMRAEHFQEAGTLYRERIIPADEDAFRTALAGYAAGRTSLPDLLNYAAAIFADRRVLTELELAYATALIEAERYTADPGRYVSLADNGNEETR